MIITVCKNCKYLHKQTVTQNKTFMNFTLQEELEMSTWSIQDDLDDKTSDDVSLT